MDMALDRAKDTWWDPTQKCIITQADAEMASILQEDKDLIFLEKKVVHGATSAVTTQINKDLLSTGSVSTFRTTVTLQTCSMQKTKTKVKIPSAATTMSSGSVTTLSIMTLSEKDMAVLLKYLMKAMHLHNQSPNPNNSVLPRQWQQVWAEIIRRSATGMSDPDINQLRKPYGSSHTIQQPLHNSSSKTKHRKNLHILQVTHPSLRQLNDTYYKTNSKAMMNNNKNQVPLHYSQQLILTVEK